jgi:hypothetical protein
MYVMCFCTKASWCFILTVLIAVLVFRYVFQSREHNIHTLLFLTNITFFASVCNAKSTICSAYSSSLGLGIMICCTNTSVSFTLLMLYATSVDNNGMSDCVKLDWTCSGCTLRQNEFVVVHTNTCAALLSRKSVARFVILCLPNRSHSIFTCTIDTNNHETYGLCLTKIKENYPHVCIYMK